MKHIAQWHVTLVVIGIHHRRHTYLAHVGGALDSLGLFLGHRQGGQKHTGQDCNDGDDHQKFNQGKTRLCET